MDGQIFVIFAISESQFKNTWLIRPRKEKISIISFSFHTKINLKFLFNITFLPNCGRVVTRHLYVGKETG